jgi:hypothetical protein
LTPTRICTYIQGERDPGLPIEGFIVSIGQTSIVPYEFHDLYVPS